MGRHFDFHYYGFITKCAEYGITDSEVVGELYKMARPNDGRVISTRHGNGAGINLGTPRTYRPVKPKNPNTGGLGRQVVERFGDRKNLGFENAQGRPDLQAQAFANAQAAAGNGPPHVYQRLVSEDRNGQPATATTPARPARPSSYIPPLPRQHEYPDITLANQDFFDEVPPPAPIMPIPEREYPDFDPRGGYMAPYFEGTTVSTRGAPLEVGPADMTTDLTIDPANTMTDLERQMLEESAN